MNSEQYNKKKRKQGPSKCPVCGGQILRIGSGFYAEPLSRCLACGTLGTLVQGRWTWSRPYMLVDERNSIKFADPAWRASWLRLALKDCARLLSPSQLRKLEETWEPSSRWTRAVLLWGSDRPIPLLDGKPQLERQDDEDRTH